MRGAQRVFTHVACAAAGSAFCTSSYQDKQYLIKSITHKQASWLRHRLSKQLRCELRSTITQLMNREWSRVASGGKEDSGDEGSGDEGGDAAAALTLTLTGRFGGVA